MVRPTLALKLEPHHDVLIVVPETLAEDVDAAGVFRALLNAEA